MRSGSCLSDPGSGRQDKGAERRRRRSGASPDPLRRSSDPSRISPDGLSISSGDPSRRFGTPFGRLQTPFVFAPEGPTVFARAEIAFARAEIASARPRSSRIWGCTAHRRRGGGGPAYHSCGTGTPIGVNQPRYRSRGVQEGIDYQVQKSPELWGRVPFLAGSTASRRGPDPSRCRSRYSARPYPTRTCRWRSIRCHDPCAVQELHRSLPRCLWIRPTKSLSAPHQGRSNPTVLFAILLSFRVPTHARRSDFGDQGQDAVGLGVTGGPPRAIGGSSVTPLRAAFAARRGRLWSDALWRRRRGRSCAWLRGDMATWSTDLSHCAPQDAPTVPLAERRRGQFCREVVEAATSRRAGPTWCSAVHCIGRIGRTRCGRWIEVSYAPGAVAWSRGVCGERGVITWIEGTASDRSPYVPQGKTRLWGFDEEAAEPFKEGTLGWR